MGESQNRETQHETNNSGSDGRYWWLKVSTSALSPSVWMKSFFGKRKRGGRDPALTVTGNGCGPASLDFAT